MKTVNEAQERAIKHHKGPMLVLAGPGSGKTLVIIKRTQHLIEQYGIAPNHILVITFTKAAAMEMQDRFERLMGEGRSGVNFGTFHAIFFKILRYAYNYSVSNIITEEERYRLLRDIIQSMELEIEDEKEFLEGIGSEISLVKGENMDISHYYSMNCSEETFQEIYKEYEKKLRNQNKIDFDDMLLLCYELLLKRADILSLWQQKYQYILIDEFQDINRIQYEIIKMLARPKNNLFIVGDDDQSIYRFRGAKPEIMLSFEEEYKGAKKVVLNKNYRSKGNIITGALKVVGNNKKRYPKEIQSVHEPGNEIDVKSFSDLQAQNQAILEEIDRYRKMGMRYSQIAVLYRTNTQPGALVTKLMEYNVPFKMRDNLPNLYEHWIAKDLICYIKLSLGIRERGLFLQVMNRPKRYISREALEQTDVDFNTLREFYMEKPYVVERIDKLVYDLTLIRRTNPYAAINYIRRAIGYDDYLKEYANFRRIKVEELYDVLSELQEEAREYKTHEEWLNHIEDYKAGLKEQAMKQNQKDVDGVILTTFHASKGLEFDVVILMDANEGITPHKKAVVPEDMEEERRMFYVAMTRAKSYLHIFYAKQRYNKELSPSRFVGELLVSPMELKEGMRVKHSIYGEGSIKKIEENKITIHFDKIFLPKVLDLEFCIRNQMIKLDD